MSLGLLKKPPRLEELEEGQVVYAQLSEGQVRDGVPSQGEYWRFQRIGGTLLTDRTRAYPASSYDEYFPEQVIVGDKVTIGNIPAGTADYDKFLVSNGGVIEYRTAAQMISDLGISTADHVHALSDLTDLVITGPANIGHGAYPRSWYSNRPKRRRSHPVSY